MRKSVSFGCMSPVSSEENTPLDLDDHGGRTFLRVLLHLTMHDYPPLVSRALHLLFRHFSQRQEVLQAFKQVPRMATLHKISHASPESARTNVAMFSYKIHLFVFVYSQVQLLVTSQDVENYKQIKSDLDQLRSIVEKSELWVYKRQGSEEGMDAGEGLCAEAEHKLVLYFKNFVYSLYFFFNNHKLFTTLVSVLLQGEAGGADRTKKPESTSSYNYRVVKEVCVQGGSVLKASSHTPASPHTHLCPPPDPAEAQQAVCPRRPVRQEEQETAAEVAEEHGGPRRGSGAPTDPIREGIECFHSCETPFFPLFFFLKVFPILPSREKICACRTS